MQRQRTDWCALGEVPGAKALASGLQTKWGLRVGLVAQSGQVVSFSASTSSFAGGVCDQFTRRQDREGSCQRSLLSWGSSGRELCVDCHGKLSAILVPLTYHGLQASLYASGFVHQEDEVEQVSRVLERAAVVRLERARVTAALRAVPKLSAPERESVLFVLECLRDLLVGEETDGFSKPPPGRNDYSDIVGSSPEIADLFSLLDRVCERDSTVLLQGENGTGKELCARAIHVNSSRRDEPFVSQNCSAFNDNLLDSELFGHRRGAFTGAVADKIGLFERADGGVLFLDEIGDMSPTMQVKLLRVLQEGVFLPVGDTVTRSCDVRIIAATNSNLRDRVSQGSFREDLFYRINVIALEVPSLRQRPSDIPALVDHFIREYARRTGSPLKTLAPKTLDLFMRYQWPGNVRELRHEIERLVVLSGDEEEIGPNLVSHWLTKTLDGETGAKELDTSGSLPRAIESLERHMLFTALEETGWNKTHAARRLGVSRRNLIRKVQALGLKPREE